jgi:dihydroflavonol-4-reductase
VVYTTQLAPGQPLKVVKKEYAMPKALVTGANGFIGSHLVRELISQGDDVRCLVRSTSDLSSIKGLPISVYIGDVRNPTTLAEPMRDIEYVYHLAAELLVTDQQSFEEANTQGTINMLEAAEKHAGSTIKRFLLVSSQASVGPGKDSTPLDETSPLQPVSWYGLSKKKAESAATSFAARLPITVVRPPSVYGEREKDISQIYDVVENRLQPKLGIKKKYLVPVYVGDLVRGMIEAAHSNNTLNQTYFLNHPDIHTTRSVVKTMATAMGKPFGLMIPVPLLLVSLFAPVAELIYHFNRLRPRMTRDKAREIAERFWVVDPLKAKKDFGWV